jgi:RNA polymerase sigma-70 factor (ECF subfamily)
MKAALKRRWEEARAAWPAIDLDEQIFAAHVASKLAPDARPEDVDRLDAAGLYLACACARAVPSALAEFNLRILSKVPEFLARIHASSALPDEVRQILSERLLVGASGEPPRIATYSGEGSLAAWVRVAAVRTALNVLEKMDEKLARADSDAVERVKAPTTPEHEVARVTQGAMFREVLEQAVSALPAQQRTALRLHFVEGLTGDEVGERLGISRATVVRWLSTARTFLLRETKRLLTERLRLTRDEAESFIATARGQLDLSLSVLLASDIRT